MLEGVTDSSLRAGFISTVMLNLIFKTAFLKTCLKDTKTTSMHYALKYPPRLEVNLYTRTHTILLSQSHSQLLGCHSWTDTSRENIWQPPSSELFLHKTPHTFVLTMIKFSVTEEVKLSFHSKLASNGLHYLKCLLCPDCSLTSLALPVCC